MRKARLKKEQKETPQATNADVTENPEESVAPPAPAQHHHEDGIFNGYKQTIATTEPHT